MRIVMEQSGPELLNLGDWAMLDVAVERCRQLFPACQISIFGYEPARLVSCIPGALPLSIVAREAVLETEGILGRWGDRLGRLDRKLLRSYPRMAFPLLRLRNYLRTRDAEIERFIAAMEDADLVLATGGGYITDSFPEMVSGVCGVLTLAQSLGKPTAMLGQGLGPIANPKLRGIARRVFSRLDLLALRESANGPRIAAEFGVTPGNVIISGDDAIEAAYRLRPPGIGSSLGLNVRSTTYSGVLRDDIDSLRRAIGRLCADLRAPIEILPISFHNDEDSRFTRLLVPDPPGLPDTISTPQDVIRLTGTCRLVITGSYHAGVFALAQGVPVIGLSKSAYYADKFDGLASQFGGGCITLALDAPDFATSLYDCALNLWEQAEHLRPELLSKAEEQIALGWSAYRRLAAKAVGS